MYVALVQHAENDIDREECRNDEPFFILQRLLISLERPGVHAVNRFRHAHPLLQVVDSPSRIAEGDPLGEIEGNGHRRELALVVDRERRRLSVVTRNSAERDLASLARMDVYVIQPLRALPELR